MSFRSEATGNGSRTPARFDATHWRGRVCRFHGSIYRPGPGSHWETLEDPEAGDSASYSDFVADPEGRYFLSDFLSGSDYSGCLVERANYRDFLEDYGDRDGVHEVYGGHGTFAIAVRIDAIDEDMAAVLDSLEDYPLISDETHGELELEAQNEAWDSWARGDFVAGLEARFSEDGFGELVFVPDGEPKTQGRLFGTGERPKPEDLEDAVVRLFETARETANAYWEIETGGGAHIDVDRVCDAVTADMLEAHGLRVEG